LPSLFHFGSSLFLHGKVYRFPLVWRMLYREDLFGDRLRQAIIFGQQHCLVKVAPSELGYEGPCKTRPQCAA